jgi:O-antigen/teichoic acid export membrane protein
MALAHHGFRRYFANTSWMFGEQLLRMIAGLFVGIWVARYLGPSKFGIYSYVLAFVSIFSGIAKLGLDGVLVRDLVAHPQEHKIYLGSAFWLKVFGAIAMLILIGVALQITNNDLSIDIYILIIASGIIFQSFEVIDFYFQSKIQSKFVSLCKILQLCISSILKIYFVLTGAELIWFVLIALIDQLTIALSLYWAFRNQKGSNFYFAFNFSIARKILIDSWPFIFSSLAVAIYMRIDQLMIKQMINEHELGIYSAALKISEVWYFIPTIISSSLAPAILNAKKTDEKLYQLRLLRLIKLLTWLSIFLAVIITFSSDKLIDLTFGPAYQSSVGVLNIQIWSGVFVFIGVASSVFFVAENYAKKVLYRTLLGAVTNVILNFYFIPKYGISGAAYATLFSQFLANFLYDFFDSDIKALLIIKIKSFLPIFTIKLKDY